MAKLGLYGIWNEDYSDQTYQIIGFNYHYTVGATHNYQNKLGSRTIDIDYILIS